MATGTRKPAGLQFVRTLMVRETVAGYEEAPLLGEPEDVVDLFKKHYGDDQDREFFIAFGVDMKQHLIRTWVVSIGSLNASIVHPRELYKAACKEGCASVIVLHNHPSGDPTPSGADIQLTERLIRAGNELGIELLDHIVIGTGTGKFTSMHTDGLV